MLRNCFVKSMAFTIMLWLVVILAKQAAGFLRKVRVVIRSEWDAGGSPAASHFLLLRQKKVTQEKATPGSSPFGFPALLANAGRCGTRARSGGALMVQFVLALRQSSRTSPAFAPLLGSSHGAPGITATTANKSRHSREGGNPSSSAKK